MKKSKLLKKVFKKTFFKKLKTKYKKLWGWAAGLSAFTLTLALGYSNCSDVKFSIKPTPVGPKECPAGQVVSGNDCIPATCDTSGVSLSDQAACPPPSTGMKTRTRTVSCQGSTAVPGPWGNWDYTSCVCPAGTGQILNPTDGTCSCPAGQTPNASGVCEPATCNLSGINLSESMPCPSGLGLAWRHRTAYCNGTTPVINAWGPWDYSTCGCPAGSGQTPNPSNGVCTCPTGQTFNPTSQKCEGTTCGPVSTPIACPAVYAATVTGSGQNTCTVCTTGGVPGTPTNCSQNYSGCTYDASACAPNGNWISQIATNYPPSFTSVDTGTTIHAGQRCPCSGGLVDIQGHCGVCPSGQIYNAGTYSCSSCASGTYYIGATGTCQPCQFGYNAGAQACNPPSMAPVTTMLNCSTANNSTNTCSMDISSWLPAGVSPSLLKITGGSLIRWFNHGNDWPHTNTSTDVSVSIVGTSLRLTVYQVRADVSITVAAGDMYSGSTYWQAGQLHDPWCEQNNYDWGTPEVPDAPIGSHFGTSEPRCDGVAGPTPYTCYPNSGQNSAYSLWISDIYCEPPPGGGGTQL